MSEELDLIQEDAEQSMKKAIGHLESELVKIRAGKANPSMLDGIVAEYYGAPTPLAQIANKVIRNAKTPLINMISMRDVLKSEFNQKAKLLDKRYSLLFQLGHNITKIRCLKKF